MRRSLHGHGPPHATRPCPVRARWGQSRAKRAARPPIAPLVACAHLLAPPPRGRLPRAARPGRSSAARAAGQGWARALAASTVVAALTMGGALSPRPWRRLRCPRRRRRRRKLRDLGGVTACRRCRGCRGCREVQMAQEARATCLLRGTYLLTYSVVFTYLVRGTHEALTSSVGKLRDHRSGGKRRQPWRAGRSDGWGGGGVGGVIRGNDEEHHDAAWGARRRRESAGPGRHERAVAASPRQRTA